MKKYLVLFVILILSISLLISGCETTLGDTLKEENKNANNDNIEEKKESREELEQKRKEELGEFYVPLIPSGEKEKKEEVEAKGLYVKANTVIKPVNKENVQLYADYIKASIEGDTQEINNLKGKVENINNFEKIIGTAVATEINTLVIDVKDDHGLMTYESNIDIVRNVKGNRNAKIKDIKGLLKMLKEYDIYPIARIVTFKDINFAKHNPDHSIKLKSGGTWKDKNGVSWVNPYDDYVWNYNVAIAREAALMGFEEVQFDYVRFPANAHTYEKITEFPGRNNREKDEAIEGFLGYAKKNLKEYNVKVSADVFGIITKTWDDKVDKIGQTWRKVARNVDVISPMIYPSHYGKGWYGFNNPDAQPYGVLTGSLTEAIRKNSTVKNPPVIRPWIQGFSSSVPYGPNEIRQQILAGKHLGINEYIVWNASNNYKPLAFVPKGEEKNIQLPSKERDILNKTPVMVLKEYLDAEKGKIRRKIYILRAIEDRDRSYDKFVQNYRRELISYDIKSSTLIDNNTAEVTLSYKYIINEGENKTTIQKQDDTWKLVKENNVWKVIVPEALNQSSKDDLKVIEVNIPAGSTPGKIADILLEKGIIKDKNTFLQKAKEMGLDNKLQSGRFGIKETTSLEDVIKIISRTL